jgi:hypothetical protein
MPGFVGKVCIFRACILIKFKGNIMKVILRIFLSLMVAVGYVNVSSAAGWSNDTTVTEIYSAGSKTFVKFNEMINPDGCVSIYWIMLESSQLLYKDIFALLLSAKLTGSSVRYYVSACNTTTTSTYPILTQLMLK